MHIRKKEEEEEEPKLQMDIDLKFKLNQLSLKDPSFLALRDQNALKKKTEKRQQA